MNEQKEAPGSHVAYVCSGEHDDGRGCMFCDGGLSACTQCGAFEGAWPDECPGERMTEQQSDAVYAGTLNFRAGQWHEGECCQVMMPSRFPEEFLRQVDANQRDGNA